MRKFILPIALIAVATSFASDMFMPIAPKTIQVGGNLQFWSVTDSYNNDGDATDIEKAEGDGTYKHETTLAPRITYGVAPNIDVTLLLRYEMHTGKNQWTKWDNSGLNRPIVTAKYGFPDLGIAGFMDLHLPFGTDEITDEDPQAEIGFGVLMDKMLGNIQLRGDISYFWDREKDSYDPANPIQINIRPGFLFTPSMIGEVNLGYWFKGKDDDHGNSVENSNRSKLDIAPGMLFLLSPTTKIECLVDYTITGKNVEGGWGISALVLHNL